MCLTMPTLRSRRPSLNELQDEYRRVLRLLELKKASNRENSSYQNEIGTEDTTANSHEQTDSGKDTQTIVEEGTNTTPRSTRHYVLSPNAISLTPTRHSGAMVELPVPLLVDILTPTSKRRKCQSLSSSRHEDSVSSICFICFNGLEALFNH